MMGSLKYATSLYALVPVVVSAATMTHSFYLQLEGKLKDGCCGYKERSGACGLLNGEMLRPDWAF